MYSLLYFFTEGIISVFYMMHAWIIVIIRTKRSGSMTCFLLVVYNVRLSLQILIISQVVQISVQIKLMFVLSVRNRLLFVMLLWFYFW